MTRMYLAGSQNNCTPEVVVWVADVPNGAMCIGQFILVIILHMLDMFSYALDMIDFINMCVPYTNTM